MTTLTARESHAVYHEANRTSWVAQQRYPLHFERCYGPGPTVGDPVCRECHICGNEKGKDHGK